MNFTEKYKIKMKYNQFGLHVEENFQDQTENILIEKFEEYVNNLKEKNKNKYNMIELGSNFAYYSMLFKKILLPNETFNIMVEPYEKFMSSGKEHFEINNFDGVFLNNRIKSNFPWCNINFECDEVKVDDLLKNYKIKDLDVLHMDIDYSELSALESAHESLSKKMIDTLFILTHDRPPGIENFEIVPIEDANSMHQMCKQKLLNYDYECIFEQTERNIGADALLIFKKK